MLQKWQRGPRKRGYRQVLSDDDTPGYLLKCVLDVGIGPFAQCGLDQALSLAIGPGRIGPCADMFQARVTASSGKGFRDIAAAIIGHDTGHFHTGPLVPGDGGPEGNNSTAGQPARASLPANGAALTSDQSALQPPRL